MILFFMILFCYPLLADYEVKHDTYTEIVCEYEIKKSTAMEIIEQYEKSPDKINELKIELAKDYDEKTKKLLRNKLHVWEIKARCANKNTGAINLEAK